MGCCSSHEVDFLTASSSKELSDMMLKQKETFEREIDLLRKNKQELSSFYTSICEDTQNYATRIENCDFKNNFSDIKILVHYLYVAVKKNDMSQYEIEKKKLENLINHHDVLEL